MTMVYVLIGLNLAATLYCILSVMRSSVITWRKADELLKADEEMLTIFFNADRIKAKAAERPGEAVDLEDLI